MRTITIVHTGAVAAAALLAAGLVFGCGGGGGGATPAAALEGHTWALTAYVVGTSPSPGPTEVEVSPAPGLVPVPAGVSADAVFADGTMSGRAPVNSYSGPYTLSGDDGITIGPLASTQMAGPPAAMDAEQVYFAALQATKTFSVSGDQLKLADDRGATLLTFTVKK